MSIATYDELKTAIADFLNREDLTSAIPTFIRLAESRMDRDLRHWKQTKRATISLAAQYNDALPADFLQPVRLQLTDGATGEVSPISVAQMLQLRSDRNDRAGRPTNYAITAEDLEVYPTPDATYSASLVYYARTTPLSADNPTNWLLTEAPDAYLYGSLLHAAPYLSEDARVQIWESLYKLAADTLTIASDDARFGGTGLRMKTRR